MDNKVSAATINPYSDIEELVDEVIRNMRKEGYPLTIPERDLIKRLTEVAIRRYPHLINTDKTI